MGGIGSRSVEPQPDPSPKNSLQFRLRPLGRGSGRGAVPPVRRCRGRVESRGQNANTAENREENLAILSTESLTIKSLTIKNRSMKSFNDKVAVITGAGSGIGRALALQLAAAGSRLAISDINEAGLAETRGLIASASSHAEVRTYSLDVSDRQAVFAHADQVRADFGTAHMIFNNAGVTIVAKIKDITIEELEWLLGINLWGVIYGTKAFLPMFLEQNEGHVINISSVFGIIAVPTQAAYHISKFGVRGFTECLSRELELDRDCRVRATCVHPGGIATNIAKAARFGKFEEEHRDETLAQSEIIMSTPPAEMATAILKGVRRNKRRVLAGKGAQTIDKIARLFPASYGKILSRLEKQPRIMTES